jgi:hypothetical protein
MNALDVELTPPIDKMPISSSVAGDITDTTMDFPFFDQSLGKGTRSGSDQSRSTSPVPSAFFQ